MRNQLSQHIKCFRKEDDSEMENKSTDLVFALVYVMFKTDCSVHFLSVFTACQCAKIYIYICYMALPSVLKRAATHDKITLQPLHPCTRGVTKCTFAIALLFSAFPTRGYEMALLEKKLKDFIPPSI